MEFFYLHIDIIIFFCFLLTNFGIVLFCTKKIDGIREYAVGYRDFSTATIAATLVSTWISGEYFLRTVSRSSIEGLFYIVPSITGDIFSMIFTCCVLAPKLNKFLGSLSVAEVMGEIYGKHVRFITSISSVLSCVFKVAVQFKTSTIILQLFFGISNMYANMFTILILLLYSTFGGIKGITITNLIQFLTLGIIVPFIALSIWEGFEDYHVILEGIRNNEIFNITNLFNHHDPRFYHCLALLIYFSVPILNPAIFQRICIAKNVAQVSRSYAIAIVMYLLISLTFFWLGILLSGTNATLSQVQILDYIINNYILSFGGKGLIVTGMIAMVMSTADSYINSATVIIANDIIKPASMRFFQKYQLPIIYISSVTINLSALILIFTSNNLLGLFLVASMFYTPIVTPALFFAIFELRTSTTSVLLGMITGAFTLIFSIYFITDIRIYQILLAIIGNCAATSTSHYFITYNSPEYIHHHYNLFKRFISCKIRLLLLIKNFDMSRLFINTLPKNESSVACLGIFSIFLMNVSTYNVPAILKNTYKEIYHFIYYSTLSISTVFLLYPLWSREKYHKLGLVIWNLGVFYILVFSSSVILLLNNFNQLQLIVVMINLVLLASLVRWNVALLMMLLGTVSSISCYYFLNLNISLLDSNIYLHLRVIYLLVLFATILILFVRPKNNELELSEVKNIHLDERVINRDREIEKLLDLKYEFLRNINHEFHAPMTGILTLSDTLCAKYDQLTEKQRYSSIEVIVRSARRLNSFVNNILDFSKLSSLTYDLNKVNVNLSQLLTERIEICRKLYVNKKLIDFFIDIEPNITFLCDEYYIAQTLDNLIINSITYSYDNATIRITLKQDNEYLWFTIKDDGISVPKEELIDIFGVFVVSSKTKTASGGRGVGLALSKKVIELHDGNIWAENDENDKTSFIFNIRKSNV